MAPQDYELQKDSPTPNIALIKEFIWWYTISTKGRLRPDGRPAVITTLTCAERFFRGFATATGNMVAEEDRLEIYRVSIVRFAKAFDVEAHILIVDQIPPVWSRELQERSLKRHKSYRLCFLCLCKKW